MNESGGTSLSADRLLLLLQKASLLVSEEFSRSCPRFFYQNNLHLLARNLSAACENLPDISSQWSLPLIEFINIVSISREDQLPLFLAQEIERLGSENFLFLLGQGRTPGSVTGWEGLPPDFEELRTAAALIHNGELSVAARALEKHQERGKDKFWGRAEGNSETKNQRADYYLEKILEKGTWWNTFFHFKHTVVFEIRIESGHGARWNSSGTEFIGFLDPFTPYA